MNKKLLSLLLICLSILMQAQEMLTGNDPQMADVFREEGKIYVVLTVIGIIFLCLVAFLIYIERKVKRLEEKIK